MSDQYHNFTYAVNRELTNELDARLLAFFGSYANAEKYAHLYVLETKEMDFTLEPDDSGLDVKYEVSIEYRIRLKTEEELAADLGPENM